MTKGTTADLPMTGGKDAITKGLDGKTNIKVPIDPLVVERAKDYARAKELAADAKDKETEKGQDLLGAFEKSKCKSVRVVTDRRPYRFDYRKLAKVVTVKDRP